MQAFEIARMVINVIIAFLIVTEQWNAKLCFIKA